MLGPGQSEGGQIQHTLICRVERKLTLSTVDNHAHDQITDVDENLGKDKAFPEVISRGKMLSACIQGYG
jgi:hypothetical protein